MSSGIIVTKARNGFVATLFVREEMSEEVLEELEGPTPEQVAASTVDDSLVTDEPEEMGGDFSGTSELRRESAAQMQGQIDTLRKEGLLGEKIPLRGAAGIVVHRPSPRRRLYTRKVVLIAKTWGELVELIGDLLPNMPETGEIPMGYAVSDPGDFCPAR